MTTSLVLRFAGPQQSWGSTKYVDRTTETVPTRSGILGILAASLGAARGQWPAWLDTLAIAARVDAAGQVETDFHTIGAPHESILESRSRHRSLSKNGTKQTADWVVPKGDGAKWEVKGSTTMLTKRQYLSDAEFLVAISGPAETVETLARVTRQPIFMPYLGRKSFAPVFPFHLGIYDGGVNEVLSTLPSLRGPGKSLGVADILADRNPVSKNVTAPVGLAGAFPWRTPR